MNNPNAWGSPLPPAWLTLPTPSTPAAAWPAPQPVAAEPAKMDEPLGDAMKARLTTERLPLTPDGVLMLWQRTQKALAAAKEDEMEIRKTAVKVYVPQPREGMNNVDLGNGYTLKAGVKFNYKLDSDIKKVEDALDRIAKVSNEAAFLADRLVSWTPNFLLTEYRLLEERAKDTNTDAYDRGVARDILKILSEVLTITDAAPTLEIKEPKAKK